MADFNAFINAYFWVIAYGVGFFLFLAFVRAIMEFGEEAKKAKRLWFD